LTEATQEATSNQEQDVETSYDKKYPLLEFKPHEDVRAAVYSARKILAKRNSEECLKLAKALVQMKKIIDKIERDAAFEAIKQNDHIDTVWLSEGRALMLWADSFDLSSLKIKFLKLFELFAVKTLMLCADFTRIKNMEADACTTDFERSCVLRAQHAADNTIMSEIVDCLARAEVANKLLSESFVAKTLGSIGGQGRTKKCAPLIQRTLQLYLKDFQSIGILTAANSIEVILKAEHPDLLELSKAKNKATVLQNWIRKYKSGKLKIPLDI
jgi:hypothetical protein